MLDDPRRAAPLLALGALALAYNVWTYSSLWSSPNGVTAAATEALPPAHVPAAAQAPLLATAALSEEEVSQIIAALPNSARDPFQFAQALPPAVLEAAAAPPALDLVLQGTLMGVRRAAWINQRALTEGEQIDGLIVERIEPGRVLLRRGDEEIELWQAR